MSLAARVAAGIAFAGLAAIPNINPVQAQNPSGRIILSSSFIKTDEDVKSELEKKAYTALMEARTDLRINIKRGKPLEDLLDYRQEDNLKEWYFLSGSNETTARLYKERIHYTIMTGHMLGMQSAIEELGRKISSSSSFILQNFKFSLDEVKRKNLSRPYSCTISFEAERLKLNDQSYSVKLDIRSEVTEYRIPFGASDIILRKIDLGYIDNYKITELSSSPAAPKLTLKGDLTMVEWLMDDGLNSFYIRAKLEPIPNPPEGRSWAYMARMSEIDPAGIHSSLRNISNQQLIFDINWNVQSFIKNSALR